MNEILNIGLEHTDAVVGIRMNVFGNPLDYALGRSYSQSFVSCLLRRPDMIGFAATVDGVVVGYVLGLPSRRVDEFRRDMRPAMIRCLLGRPSAWLEPEVRRRAVHRAITDLVGRADDVDPVALPQPAVSVLSLAVHAPSQRTGIGTALLVAFEVEAQRQGARSVQLIVSRANTAARQWYEKRGWVACDGGARQPYIRCYQVFAQPSNAAGLESPAGELPRHDVA